MEKFKNTESIKENIKNYYGKTLGGSKDLKTSACCSTELLPDLHKEILKELGEEVVEKFYGCGSPIPHNLKGCTVLDLGCGTGRDVYVASKLVGADGFVIGVDMTDEQLKVAEKNINYHKEKFGFSRTNVKFIKGEIEDLQSLGIKDNSIDVVISNCVLNLSLNKETVFKEIFRVLKPGGELYFSDIYADRRVPEDLKNDHLLMGECLAGALYTEDFRRILQKTGCPDYRIISSSPITVDDENLKKKLGDINFYSLTIRAFKLDDLEDICEDYGQKAVYLGTIEGAANYFKLDTHHTFISNKPIKVCGNTASMLSKTRFAKHFTVLGNRSGHLGIFNCKNKKIDNRTISNNPSKKNDSKSCKNISCC